LANLIEVNLVNNTSIQVHKYNHFTIMSYRLDNVYYYTWTMYVILGV